MLPIFLSLPRGCRCVGLGQDRRLLQYRLPSQAIFDSPYVFQNFRLRYGKSESTEVLGLGMT